MESRRLLTMAIKLSSISSGLNLTSMTLTTGCSELRGFLLGNLNWMTYRLCGTYQLLTTIKPPSASTTCKAINPATVTTNQGLNSLQQLQTPLTSILKVTVCATTLITSTLCTWMKGISMMLASITMKKSKMWSQQHPRIYSIQHLFTETRPRIQAIWLFNRNFSHYLLLLICILPTVRHHLKAMKWTSLSQHLNLKPQKLNLTKSLRKYLLITIQRNHIFRINKKASFKSL